MSGTRGKIILLGGGGHAAVLIELIRSCDQYEIEGILNESGKSPDSVFGIPILGNDGLLPDLYSQGIRNACVAVGSIQDNSNRKALYEKVKGIGFHVPSLVHVTGYVSESTSLSEGVQVMAGAVLQSLSIIGENTIINTGAIVEHGCRIGRNVHICPGAIVSGDTNIGDNTFIGAGATIKQGTVIGQDSLVAAGAVVVKDVPDGAKIIGVPAK
ncbi:MAG TPA: acetyltransferase [Nitrospirae bacterium]|nr:acetyltransferase [Nitrospirota bacterium]